MGPWQRAVNAKLSKLPSGGDTEGSEHEQVDTVAQAVGWTLKKDHSGRLWKRRSDLGQYWGRFSQGLGAEQAKGDEARLMQVGGGTEDGPGISRWLPRQMTERRKPEEELLREER